MEKFSKQIKADQDGYYMSCPEFVAEHLAEQLKGYKSAVELCCAVGMTVIQLAKKIGNVVGIDIHSERIEAAKYNAMLYGVSDKTRFIIGSVTDEKLLEGIKADVAILDPDWRNVGGQNVSLADETSPDLKKLIYLTRRFITENIVLRIPNTFDFATLAEFGPCKIENIIYKDKIKFKIAYFLETIKENIEDNIHFN